MGAPMPARCEARLPLEFSNAYLKPLRVNEERKAQYQKWVADGMPRLHGDEAPSD